MEIAYLYIESFMKVSDLQLNFSNKLNIFLDENSNELKITRKENYVKDFYNVYQSNVSSLSVVIGENGSGKTSILEYIKSIYREGVSAIKRKNILGIMKDNMNLELYIDKKNLEDFIINIEGDKKSIEIESDYILHEKNNLEELKIKIIAFSAEEDLNIWSKNKKIIIADSLLEGRTERGMSLVYYSNQFENNYNYNLDVENETKYYDLSLNSRLILSSKKSSSKSVKMIHNKFKIKDMNNKINFLSNKRKNNFLDTFLLYPQKISINSDNNFSESISNILDEIYIEIFEMSVSKKHIINKLLLASIIDVILNDPSFNKKIKLSDKDFSTMYKDYNFNNMDFSKFQNDFEKMIENKIITESDLFNQVQLQLKHLISYFKKQYGPYDKLIKLVNRLYDENYSFMSIGEEHNYSLTVESNLKNFKLIKEINNFNFYNENLPVPIEFNWHNLSQGESNLFSFFSDLYNCIRKISDESILILIDECDLTMHPEWQRNYLHMVLTFLQMNFEDKKFQIILTTHSPIVISDFPSFSIVSLNDANNLNDFSMTTSNIEQTFAANIHDIYKHGQYLYSTTGKFAEEKINEVFNLIHKEIMSKEDYDYASNVINLIGDPFVKSQLITLLEDSRHNSLKYDSDDEEMRHLISISEKTKERMKIIEERSNRNDIDKLR